MRKILRELVPCITGLLSYFLLATLVELCTGKNIHRLVYDFFKRFMY